MNDTDDLLGTLRAASAGTLVDRLGIEILEVGPERVVARMPVAGNTQPHGLLHGGASAALAETVGSFAATIHAGPGRAAVGTEISATHHRGVRTGYVTATATGLYEGRRTATYEIVIVDDEGRRTCTARLSCMLVQSAGQ
jgi:1,4-dihydroxy-2-naphthoyl-CoA hydrolase